MAVVEDLGHVLQVENIVSALYINSRSTTSLLACLGISTDYSDRFGPVRRDTINQGFICIGGGYCIETMPNR